MFRAIVSSRLNAGHNRFCSKSTLRFWQSAKSNAEELLAKNFDLRRLNTFAGSFSDAAFSVIEVVEIGNTLFVYRMADERDLAIQDARQLRERSAALLAMASDELNELTIIDVALTPVVKQKPAPSTVNQLGSLNVAAVAA